MGHFRKFPGIKIAVSPINILDKHFVFVANINRNLRNFASEDI